MSLGFYFNERACSGCRACQTACKDRNDLEVGQLFRHVRTFQTGTFPNATMYHYSATCNHCDSPACVANCPTGAMQKADDGTVQHDDELCIGCGSCANSCPYEVPVVFEDKKIAGKCDACKPFRDRGLNPVCVDACNMRALEFGDIDELRAKHEGDAMVTELVSDLPILASSAETNPNTIINPKEAALAADFTEVLL